MNHWRKALAWCGGALLLLALAGAIVLHSLVDPERLKELARDKAQAAWGRDLSIADASLDLWPVPALHGDDITLSNPEWAQEPHFLRADSVTARLELLPLLKGKVQLKALSLEGVKVALETSAEGLSNAPGAGGDKPRATADLFALTDLRIANADIYQRTHDEPPILWHIDEATLAASPGLRDARIVASLSRNRSALKLAGEFADLSALGTPGATSQGTLDLDWGTTRATIAGRFPLHRARQAFALSADIKSSALGDMLAFFGNERRPKAPAEAHVETREVNGRVELTKFSLAVGALRISGNGQIAPAARRPAFQLHLQAERLDWARAMLDVGGPVLPPLPPDQVFHDQPLAWPLLVAMHDIQGVADVEVKSLRLRNGVELKNAKARVLFDGDVMKLQPFSAEMLGGNASGSMVFEGGAKAVKVEFAGNNLLLERWFSERGSKIPLAGGPMSVRASLSSAGNSLKELAAHVSGPLRLRMGHAVWTSKKASDAEAMMTNAFASRDASEIVFECVSAVLPLKDGVAAANAIVGFRTSASDLITNGRIDLRAQALELRGRVRAKQGMTLGLATIAGDVKIEGPLRHPSMKLDPEAKPLAVLRAGAAIATLGLTALGTAFVDAAESGQNDPCKAPFNRK